jgi:hypothetical protein
VISFFCQAESVSLEWQWKEKRVEVDRKITKEERETNNDITIPVLQGFFI